LSGRSIVSSCSYGSENRKLPVVVVRYLYLKCSEESFLVFTQVAEDAIAGAG
jgi:hypothetical protein